MPLYKLRFKCSPNKIPGEKEKDKNTKVTLNLKTKHNTRRQNKTLVAKARRYYSKNNPQILCPIIAILV